MGNFQHYVPCVYLKGFTDPRTPSGQEPYVWAVDLQEKKFKNRSPRKIAGENDYYESVGITGGPGAGKSAYPHARQGRFSERWGGGFDLII